MNLIEKNWSEILEQVRKEHELSDVSFETWLLPLKVYSTDNHVVKIIVPMGEQMITYLNSKFKTPIYVAIAEFTGEKYTLQFFTQHSMQEQGSHSVAASYIGLEKEDGTMYWGAGTDTDVITASTNALLSAFYNMTKGDVK